MSNKSYVRTAIPANIDNTGLAAFQRGFHHKFNSAGGEDGAKILKITTDAFNSGSRSLLCAQISGNMTPAQAALVL